MRVLLAVLVILATAGFVAGTSIERGDRHATHVEGVAGEASHSETGETGNETTESTHHKSSNEEFRPFGVDIEAVPFIVLAALASLGLAFAAWSRPRSAGVLAAVAVAMLLFAVLDVREVVHQSDESRTGLEVLAAAIAVLHAAAAVTAGAMARPAR